MNAVVKFTDIARDAVLKDAEIDGGFITGTRWSHEDNADVVCSFPCSRVYSIVWQAPDEESIDIQQALIDHLQRNLEAIIYCINEQPRLFRWHDGKIQWSALPPPISEHDGVWNDLDIVAGP